jgi:dTDP-4-amino-4,6-dideoxygalactose transaminase
MKVPLLDLKRQYLNIKDEANDSVLKVLENASYIMGENVVAFEHEFANYVGVRHAISVGNGTDALVITLKAFGIGVGDEVITTPYTFFATAEAISTVGATPVFVDVRLDTFNIDEDKIEEKITDKTKAILPVHIFGQCAEMDKILNIAKKYNIAVIEDACQAAGAEYRGKKAGSLGDASCFSFFPTKNLGCAGDGGMICTDDDDIATICRALRVHGSGEMGERAYNLLNSITAEVEQDHAKDNTVYNPKKYYNYLIGHNSRLDELQAALLRIKLRKLDGYVEKRRAAAHYYNTHLPKSIVSPTEVDGNKHAYHLYIVQSECRQEITLKLKEAGIATGIYYPVPVHLQKCYCDLGYIEGSLPNAEYLSQRTFAIPLFPEISENELKYIINVFNS